MEAQTAFIGADGGTELNPITPVHVDLTIVVHPGHAEGNHPLRLHKGLDDPVLFIFRMLVHDQVQAFQNLQDCLMKLALIRIAGDHLCIYVLQIFAF